MFRASLLALRLGKRCSASPTPGKSRLHEKKAYIADTREHLIVDASIALHSLARNALVLTHENRSHSSSRVG
jgi:hypothetical protein